ncbi:L-threonylcarbamoyladenylate synthase [Armatimonas sp.]|uniref:L-threonylcarbamoyladenylate synthase n=1 Tax=Armatimonas sp. TaxID=1872638 RepID=UPI00286C7BF5|nr:L-threonylcarbamoyladenylate synthase [Armatimonas sp.]
MSARITLPDDAALAEAAERLRGGELVAFPTETVYGLGANALDADAVAKIYAAKGRPATNPIIVHVASVEQAKALVKTWPAIADELAAQHWPGPLTLVLEKADHIPDIVTAGGPTVGIRIPNHPVALELLRQAGVPIAAPSANRSEEVSPTFAIHVQHSLGEFVDDLLILDGGGCRVGIESTVLDVTCDPPRVLRPGMAKLNLPPSPRAAGEAEANVARSPGQMLRHYAPKAPLLILPIEELVQQIQEGDGLLVRRGSLDGKRPEPGEPGRVKVKISFLRHDWDAEHYAKILYWFIRVLDRSGVSRILVEAPPTGPEWDAIWDRLRRAASPAD